MREGPDSESKNRIWRGVPGRRHNYLRVIHAFDSRTREAVGQRRDGHPTAQPQAAGAQGADRLPIGFHDAGESAGNVHDSHLVKGGQGREPDELTETAGSLLILYVLGANALLLCAVVWWLVG